MVSETGPAKEPPLGLRVGVATIPATAVLTLRLKLVVRVCPPPLALTETR
jgi:hypothetical protein